MMTTNNRKTKKYITKGSASISLPVASSGRSAQDGRWRRGRHTRVKAEARPASRFTRRRLNPASFQKRYYIENTLKTNRRLQ